MKTALRRFGVYEASSLVVAVSGGADSVSLLDALARLSERGKLQAEIFAAHLNHQLRGEESDGDEAFVQRLAASYEIKSFVERATIAEIAKSKKQNLEATARRLRYEFLTRAAENCGASFVLTAHTQDDQAETVLMRLLRGTGAEGLRGIHSFRPLGEAVKLFRPLLGVTRAEVLEHCEHYKLEFRTDSSNLSPDFTRNRIRHELLPLLKSFNPRANEALARAAELVAEDEDFLQQVAFDVLAEARRNLDLNAKLLREHPPAIRRRVLRLWLSERRSGLKRIEFVHIAAIEQLIARGQGGRIIELPGGWRVSLKSGSLRMASASDPKPQSPSED